MDANQLLDLVSRYQQNRDFITNEEMTKMALVVPFIRLLGYDPNNPRELRLEFCADFAQGDGKKHQDRMDYVIFDRTGMKLLMVIEAKPLGTDLNENSKQLARYIGQEPDLHFGILTNGCCYKFFGDLDTPNVMDKNPFFEFSLDTPNTDWARVGQFLSKFSRDTFNAETLVTDAENSRYRQAMTEKIAATLRNPAADDGFMQWLTSNVYTGKRTTRVMERLAELAKESVEPALVSVLEDDFLDRLKQRFQRVRDTKDDDDPVPDKSQAITKDEPAAPERKSAIVTTEEELEFYAAVKEICVSGGIAPDDVIYRDTVNYFNVSYRRPTKWFLRFFGDSKRKNIVSPLTVDESKQLAPAFEIEESPPVFGKSRIYIDGVSQLPELKAVILQSLEISKGEAD